MPREPGNRRKWKDATWIDFSKMIRIEASDQYGICTCVTCGCRRRWNDGIDAGHFLAGRRESIIFESIGVHPECRPCNTGSCSHVNRFAGALKKETVTIAYTRFMVKTYGQEEIDRLILLRNTSVTWTIEQLREMRAEYKARFKTAKEARGL